MNPGAVLEEYGKSIETIDLVASSCGQGWEAQEAQR